MSVRPKFYTFTRPVVGIDTELGFFMPVSRC